MKIPIIKKYFVFLILIIPMVLSNCKTYAQHIDTAFLTKQIPILMESGDVPGLSISVIYDGVPYWSAAFGTLNDSLQTPVNRNSIFSAASLSKPVFAYLVMRLSERKEFDLDTPLAEMHSNTRMEHDSRYKKITARMVLSHTTGLPNWGGSELKMRFDPGTGFDYSGEGYVYLQRVIESMTGLTLEELAHHEVFEPLNMKNSSFVWQERFTGNAVYGKAWASRVSNLTRYEEPNAAFSLLTTAEDYSRFVSAVLNHIGLGTQQVELMLSPHVSVHRPWRPTEADDYVYWGLGWGLQKIEEDWAFFHWGDNGPFKAYVLAYPNQKSGVVYFANSHDGLSIANDIASFLKDEKHWALKWLNYARHNNPQRLSIKKVQLAAMTEGSESAMSVFREIQSNLESKLTVNDIGNLAEFLSAHEMNTAALQIMEIALKDYTKSVDLYNRYAGLLLAAGKYKEAISSHQRVLDIEPENENAHKRIEWIKQRMSVENQPIKIATDQLALYTGDYGPRHIRLKNSTLYYQREGNPEYRMIPLSQVLFALEGMETFRLQFEVDGDGRAIKVIGFYINERSDENSRTK